MCSLKQYLPQVSICLSSLTLYCGQLEMLQLKVMNQFIPLQFAMFNK